MLEAFDFLVFEFFFRFGPHVWIIRLAVFEQVPEDAGEFVATAMVSLWTSKPT